MPKIQQLILIRITAVHVTVLPLPQMRKSQAAVIHVTKYEKHTRQFHGLLAEEKMSNNASVNIMANAWIHNAKKDVALKVVSG